VDPLDYVRAIIRRWPIVLILTLVGGALGFFSVSDKPQEVRSYYTATHTLLTTAQSYDSSMGVGTVTFAQIPVFATTGEVPRIVAEELGYNGPPAQLAAQVTVTTDYTTGIIRFSTSGENANEVVRLADTFADETVRYLGARQEDARQANLTEALGDMTRLEEEIAALDTQIAGEGEGTNAQVLRAQRDAAVREYSVSFERYRALSEESAGTLNLTTLERAQPVAVNQSGFTAPQSRTTRALMGAALGVLLGLGVALLAERFDARLRDRRRSEEIFGAPVVAELPTLTRKQRAERLIVGPEQHHLAAEAYRSLRTSITFMAVGGQPQSEGDHVGVVLLTSPGPGEGKTTTAVNLAAAFAETGRSVLLVNSDFRRPIAPTMVLDERPPMPAGLAGIDRLDPEEWITPTRIPGLGLLDLAPLGGSPGDLTRATLRLVHVLAERVDVVIIDTPPLAVTTEALEFVPLSDVTVLIGRLGHTTVESAQRAGELARFGGSEQVAIALTDTGRGRTRSANYYYGEERSGRGGKRRQRGPETAAMVPGLIATAAPAVEDAVAEEEAASHSSEDVQAEESAVLATVESEAPAVQPDPAEEPPAEPAPVGAALERPRRTSVQRDVPSFDEILHGTS